MSDATSSGGWSRTPDGRRQYDFIAGVVIAVLGLVLLASSFLLQNPVPLTVRGSVVIFVAVGIAVAAGWLRVLNQQDFYGGMSLILLALTAFVASNDLPGMRGFAFGPGTAPRLFALTLALLSLLVVVTGLMIKGPQITAYNIRGIVFIIGAILAFAATIRTLGLVIASFASIVICAAAAQDVKWRETVIWAALLTAFCSVLFPWGLNLPFQLWPRFWQ
jgi:putative tricarboxylic transport membrane protein